jgi:hypothetical protein
MPTRSKRSRPEMAHDVGTLWTLQHREHTARCGLFAWRARWEVRVLVDGDILLTEHCTRTDAAFSTAEGWKRRLLEDGWQQLIPRSPDRAA